MKKIVYIPLLIAACTCTIGANRHSEVDSSIIQTLTASSGQSAELDSYNPKWTAPKDNCGKVIRFGQLNSSAYEDYAIVIDSFGQERYLDISDAMIGDEYSIRYGVVIEKTYEGYDDQNNDYYIVEFTNGDLHEVESEDLIFGDKVTVYFYGDHAVRTYSGWE